MVHHQAVDNVVAQAVGIGGIMPEGGKPPGPRIVPVQSAHTCRTTGNRSRSSTIEITKTLDRFAERGPPFAKKLYFPVLPSIRVSPRALPTQMFSWLSAYTAVTERAQKALRIVGLHAVALERQRFPLKPVQSGRRRAHPDTPLAVLEHRHQHILADAVWIERRVAVSDRVPPAPIDLDQAATPRCQPQVAVGVFVDSHRPADLRCAAARGP